MQYPSPRRAGTPLFGATAEGLRAPAPHLHKGARGSGPRTGREGRLPLIDDLKGLIEHETTAAQQLLKTIVEAMPNSLEARLLLGTSHLRRLEFEIAQEHYRAAIEIDPRSAEALNRAAFCDLAVGNYVEALAAYEHAFNALSGANALRYRALLSHRLGRIDAAIRLYRQLLETCQPTSPEITPSLQGLAAALRDAGRVDESEEVLRRLDQQYREKPLWIASTLVARNNSDDFFEWSRYADKACLAEALTARKSVDPGGRFPESFVLPRDRQALEAFAAGPDAPALYIVKPIRSSGGQGITVVRDLSEALHRQDVVVQRYLDRPYLIDGRKGHCRIYGLVTSADPLRAYVYSEGIVRIAPEPYAPKPDAPGGASMHVTNTALHLGDPRLVISQDPEADDVGAVRSLSALLRRLGADGHDPQVVSGEIKALMEWFVRLVAAEGLFARQAALGGRRSFSAKLFGLDVLIDDEGHPWLIEVQRIPAARGQPLVERINGEMYQSIFHMTQTPLLDGAAPGEIERLRTDEQARREREAALEVAARGKFVPLDL